MTALIQTFTASHRDGSAYETKSFDFGVTSISGVAMTPIDAPPIANNILEAKAETIWRRPQVTRRVSVSSLGNLGEHDVLLGELDEIAVDSKYENWNGHGAKPVKEESLASARELLVSMAERQVPMPCFCGCLPSGHVTLNWRRNDYDITLIVQPDGTIEWGGKTPGTRQYGEGKLPNIPNGLEDLLKRIGS